MGQITKEFAQNLLERTERGLHINTTVGEEQQLLNAWFYWNEHYYEPRIAKLRLVMGQQDGEPIGHAEGQIGGGTSN